MKYEYSVEAYAGCMDSLAFRLSMCIADEFL